MCVCVCIPQSAVSFCSCVCLCIDDHWIKACHSYKDGVLKAEHVRQQDKKDLLWCLQCQEAGHCTLTCASTDPPIHLSCGWQGPKMDSCVVRDPGEQFAKQSSDIAVLQADLADVSDRLKDLEGWQGTVETRLTDMSTC